MASANFSTLRPTSPAGTTPSVPGLPRWRRSCSEPKLLPSYVGEAWGNDSRPRPRASRGEVRRPSLGEASDGPTASSWLRRRKSDGSVPAAARAAAAAGAATVFSRLPTPARALAGRHRSSSRVNGFWDACASSSDGGSSPWTAALASRVGRRPSGSVRSTGGGYGSDSTAREEVGEKRLLEERLRDTFLRYDRDCNGYLSKDELPPVFKDLGLTLPADREGGVHEGDLALSQAFINRQFELMDKNGDGRISFDEFAQYYDRWVSMVDALKNSNGPSNFRRSASNSLAPQ